MAELFYRPRARLDLVEIFRHIAEINPDAAERVVREIDAKDRLLAASPGIGQAAENVAPRLRRFPAGNYLIFYQQFDHGIEVVRILHGARDIESLFHS